MKNKKKKRDCLNTTKMESSATQNSDATEMSDYTLSGVTGGKVSYNPGGGRVKTPWMVINDKDGQILGYFENEETAHKYDNEENR